MRTKSTKLAMVSHIEQHFPTHFYTYHVRLAMEKKQAIIK